MANSKYEYVRSFEQPDTLLANTWIVVRIDGRGFSKLTARYNFTKPNDEDALHLMNAAAEAVMKDLPDLVIAYGNSDEYSFVFHKDCTLFDRRASKLTTTIVSTFTSHYVFLWPKYLPDKPLSPPLPSFDGRAVCYPSDLNLRDYMSWRQVDCHINNLYNTTFWALVQQGGWDPRKAEQRLSGTVSSDKNEILFQEFGINYNNEPECFKKGTVIYRDFFPPDQTQETVVSVPTTSHEATIVSPQPKRIVRAQESPFAFPDPKQPSQVHELVLRDTSSEKSRTPSVSSEPGPTFLSTTSTPSPPPPRHREMIYRAELPNPLRSNPVSPGTDFFPISNMPLSPPSTVASPYDNLISPYSRFSSSVLAPMPLSPPVLKPSSKPPTSLNPPNPTTRSNFSPTFAPSPFPNLFPITASSRSPPSVRPTSQSMSVSRSSMDASNVQYRITKQRSPSQPHLPTYFSPSGSSGPPVIPLRISSIPVNAKPRKLSLQKQESNSTLKPGPDSKYQEHENHIHSQKASIAGHTPPQRISPPLRTNKALPSPPLNLEEEMRTREKVMGSTSQAWSMYPVNSSVHSPRRRASDEDSEKRAGLVWSDDEVVHPGIAELAAVSLSTDKATTMNSNIKVSPNAEYTAYRPEINQTPSPKTQGQPAETSSHRVTASPKSKLTLDTQMNIAAMAVPPPLRQDAVPQTSSMQNRIPQRRKAVPDRASQPVAHTGYPVPMSRTAREKDRKKRSRARIIVEHVDIIKDEFWQRRPWLLSGRAG